MCSSDLLSDFLARRAADTAGSDLVSETFRSIGLQQAMLIMPVLSLLLGLVLYFASRHIVRDMRRRDVALHSAAD